MFFTITAADINRFFPINNSFDDAFFTRFVEDVSTAQPFTWLFDVWSMQRQFPTFADWLAEVMKHLPEGTPSFEDDVIFYLAASVFEVAIPYLDVVISRGGIVTGDGRGLAPASSQRVERLIEETKERRRRAFILLFDRLAKPVYRTAFQIVTGCNIGAWQTTLFSHPDDLRIAGDYMLFFSHYDLIVTSQLTLQLIGLPEELIRRLVTLVYNGPVTDPPEYKLIARAKVYMLYELHRLFHNRNLGGVEVPPRKEDFIAAIDGIRHCVQDNLVAFPEYDCKTDPLLILHPLEGKEWKNFFV